MWLAVCWAVSAGGFPITRTGAAYTGLPAGAWAVWSWVWWLLFPEGPAAGFQRGPLFGVALTGRGAVVVLVVLSLPDLWMISPAECGCSGQHGRRSGCVVLSDRVRWAVLCSIMQKKKPVRLGSRAGFRAVWGADRVGLRVLHSFQRGRLGV